MQPTNAEQQETETCPNCDSEITFREKDGDIEFWDCPNCGKINLKKEQWKKMMLTPSTLPDVHVNCNFCKNKHSEKCPDSPNPDTCPMYDENKNISHAEKIVMLIDQESPTFLNDQYGNCHVWIKDKAQKTLDIHSNKFKQLCRDRFYRTFGKIPKTDSVKDAIKTFESLSRNTPRRTLRPRVTQITNEKGEKEIWIDSCNKHFQSIRIKDGYTIQDETPPMFKRYKHMKELVLPRNYDANDVNDCSIPYLVDPPLSILHEIEKRVGGEKIGDTSSIPSTPSYPYLMRTNYFMNLSSGDFFLTLVHIVNSFSIDCPQTLLSINGKKGSGKTNVSETIKKILDPSITLTLDMPKTRDELLHNLDHHFYPCFDNVSYLSHEFSDIFCRTLTGAGTFKRMLWTDDEEFIRALLKSLNINGINVIVVREDILDRTILIFALPFNDNRKTKAQLETEFEQILPFILHDLYLLVSKVMSILPETESPTQFRMMDFGKVGCAVAKALGYSREYFIDIYTKKLNDQIKEAIYNHVFGNVLLTFMDDKPEWQGSSTELFVQTKAFAKNEMDVSTRVKAFPSAPNLMSRQLNDLTDAFSKIGIELIYNRDAIARGWTIVNHNFKKPDEPKTESEKLEELKNWIKTKQDMFDSDELRKKIAELGFVDDPEKIIQRLHDDGDLRPDNYIDNLGGSQ